MTIFKSLLRCYVSHAAAIFVVLGLFLLVYVPRVISLDAHWSSDEAKWLRRSTQFMSVVKAGEFPETLITHHPGVTTMWLALEENPLKRVFF